MESHPRTHAMFRYDRQSAVKKKGSGVLLYIPVKLAPKLRPDLSLFDKEKYESVWVECKSTFNISSKEKMLANLCYNPKKFFDDMRENTIIGISETWLKKEDSDNLWNLTLERMRCSDMIGNQR